MKALLRYYDIYKNEEDEKIYDKISEEIINDSKEKREIIVSVQNIINIIDKSSPEVKSFIEGECNYLEIFYSGTDDYERIGTKIEILSKEQLQQELVELQKKLDFLLKNK